MTCCSIDPGTQTINGAHLVVIDQLGTNGIAHTVDAVLVVPPVTPPTTEAPTTAAAPPTAAPATAPPAEPAPPTPPPATGPDPPHPSVSGQPSVSCRHVRQETLG